METMHYTRFESPFGALVIGVSARGLAVIEFDSEGEFPRSRLAQQVSWEPSEEATAGCVAELREYFAGRRREFTVALDLRGTDFQLRCWRALLAIPYGETRSYAHIAREVGCPKGFRAVGMANHDNPLPIVVPCHRVLASDGTLGGYAGGLTLKRQLLELEGALAPMLV